MMRNFLSLIWLACLSLTSAERSRAHVPVALFSELEELSRIVDIAYCVGLTSAGISKPFTCASRCAGFDNFELVTTFNTGLLQSESCGYIALDHGKQRIILAFRGTYSIANTIVDLSTIPQKYEPYPGSDGDDGAKAPKCQNCTVHSGFHSSWVNTRAVILPFIEQSRMLYPDYNVHLVGHSLGGAVAALGGLDFHARGWDPVVTTYGQPRVGNAAFVEYLDDIFELKSRNTSASSMSKFRRITHIDDPVPLLPLSEWGYAMHAGEIHITKSSLSPDVQDLIFCEGDNDALCIAGQDSSIPADNLDTRYSSESGRRKKRDLPALVQQEATELAVEPWGIPSRYKLWQLFFAHRDYFWRLGLCVPSASPLEGGKYERLKADL